MYPLPRCGSRRWLLSGHVSRGIAGIDRCYLSRQIKTQIILSRQFTTFRVFLALSRKEQQWRHHRCLGSYSNITSSSDRISPSTARNAETYRDKNEELVQFQEQPYVFGRRVSKQSKPLEDAHAASAGQCSS